MLNHIVITTILLLEVYEILECHIVNDLVDGFVHFVPDEGGGTVVHFVAGLFLLDAGNRGEASLGKAQDLTDCVVIRTLGQFVSALESAVRLKNIGTVQNRDDLFQIFL